MPLEMGGAVVFQILAHDEVIGTSSLVHIDAGMGVVFGVFIPTRAYLAVRHVFVAFRDNERWDNERWAVAQAARDALGLRLISPHGVLIPMMWIHIYDLIDEPDTDELEDLEVECVLQDIAKFLAG